LVDFDPFLLVSLLQGSLAVTIIKTDSSEKPNCQLGFELQSSHLIENRSSKSASVLKYTLVEQPTKWSGKCFTDKQSKSPQRRD